MPLCRSPADHRLNDSSDLALLRNALLANSDTFASILAMMRRPEETTVVGGSMRRDMQPRLSRLQAFTLFALCISLFLVAVSVYLAVPLLQERLRTSRAAATISDLKVFAAAFDQYAHDGGDWPETAAPGDIPRGMEKMLAGTHWQQRSPIGGTYTWMTDTIQQGGRVNAAIVIATTAGEQVSDDIRQLEALKQLAAAGGLKPDRLRLGFRNEPLYILEY